MPDLTPPVDRGDDLTPPAAVVEETAPPVPAAEPAEPEKDSLDNGEETPEEEAARKLAEIELEKKRNIRIPKARFDEAQAKARIREQQLLDQIAQLRGGQQADAAQTAVDAMKAKITALQDKYEESLLDGKKDVARATRLEIDSLRDQLLEHQTSAKSEAARAAALEDVAYNTQLARLEAMHPALDPEHADFDQDKVVEVSTLMEGLVKAGTPRAQALAKAAKYVFPDTAVSPPPSPASADLRAVDARRKAAAASAKQPPKNTQVGIDSDKLGATPGGTGVDIMRMSQKAFDKLSDEVKSRMRGDVIE